MTDREAQKSYIKADVFQKKKDKMNSPKTECISCTIIIKKLISCKIYME